MPQIEHEAVALARRRLEEQRALLGDHHPDYATALNQCALLAIKHGEPQEAEPWLLQALEIRKQTMGEDHADYATNLSGLAGLHWARGDLAGAEPLLRQAIDIRLRVFGPDHSKTVASLRSLDELQSAKAGTESAGVFPELAPADITVVGTVVDATASRYPYEESSVEPPIAASTPMASSELVEVSTDLAALRERSDRLGRDWLRLADELSRAAEAMRQGGVPCSGVLAEELRSSATRFDALREDVALAALALGLDGSAIRAALDREALDAHFPELAQAERRVSEAADAQRRSLELLEQALDLRHAAGAEFPPLDDCLRQVRCQREAIAAARPVALPDDVAALAAGTHPLCALLALAANDDQVGDESWTEFVDAVRNHFGEPLAVAAARGRLVFASVAAVGT
jgi:hypothetical protein